MTLLNRFLAFSDRHFAALFILALIFYAVGFLLHSDFSMDESPYVSSYSLTLGANCEADIKQCHVKAKPVVGYRVETTRNEVVAFMPDIEGMLAKYDNCQIWDTSNWDCELGKISMRDGVLQHNAFEANNDVYYVPKTAWKLAKLHILPVNSVRRAPPPPRARKI